MSFDTPPPAAPPPAAPPPTGRSKSRPGLKVALIGAGVIAGAIGATAFGASAVTSSSGLSSATASSSAPSSSSTQAPPRGPGGADPVRSDEKSVTAAQEATLKAAALKAVPGGTVIRIETDAGDAVYEAHMKKADGTLVTVKFDKFMAVTAVESGMGKGDPAPAGRPNR